MTKEKKIRLFIVIITAIFCAAVIMFVEQNKTSTVYAQVESEFTEFSKQFLETHYRCYVGFDMGDPILKKIKSEPFILDLSYEPENLVAIPNQYLSNLGAGSLVRENILNPTIDLIGAASSSGYQILVNSGFRDSGRQAAIFSNPINTAINGFDRAARAGASEHQLGTAVDFSASQEGYAWIDQNAHRFGFTVSYPEGAEQVTGFIHEPWHLRYVGVEYATQLFNEELPVNENNDLFLAHPDFDIFVPVSYAGNDLEIVTIVGQARDTLLKTTNDLLTEQIIQAMQLIIGGEEVSEILSDEYQYDGYVGHVWHDNVVIVHKMRVNDNLWVYGFKERESNRTVIIADRNTENQIKELAEFLSDRCF